jgi:hypothetical protein
VDGLDVAPAPTMNHRVTRATLSTLVSITILASCTGSDGDGITTCEGGGSCSAVDASCVADDDELCVCRLTSARPMLFCEPAICAESSLIEGDACPMPGLRCGYDGIGQHSVCADSTWLRCVVPELDHHCPSSMPSEGERCCVVTDGPPAPQDDCEFFDGSVWRCESDAWRRQPSPL